MFVLALTLRFAVAIVLAVAACAKARSFDAFRQTVDAVVPWHRGVSAIAGAVIATEATLAGLLAAGVLANAVAAATLVLFLGFAALSLWAERRGLHVQCSCFGRSERELGKDTLVTSLMLAGATLAYWVLLGRTEAHSPWARRPSPSGSASPPSSADAGCWSRESWPGSSVREGGSKRRSGRRGGIAR